MKMALISVIYRNELNKTKNKSSYIPINLHIYYFWSVSITWIQYKWGMICINSNHPFFSITVKIHMFQCQNTESTCKLANYGWNSHNPITPSCSIIQWFWHTINMIKNNLRTVWLYDIITCKMNHTAFQHHSEVIFKIIQIFLAHHDLYTLNHLLRNFSNSLSHMIANK